MSIESPKDTLTRFSNSWYAMNPNSLLSEFISIARETRREPDSYHFFVKNKVLIDPNTGRPVLDFIYEGAEKDIARDLQSWASETDEGMAIWISPKAEGVYPCPKVIVHQIVYTPEGQKAVLNSAILFDGEIINPKYKRRNLYTFSDSDANVLKILSFIRRKSSKKQFLKVPDGTLPLKASYFVSQIRMGVPRHRIIEEMSRNGFLGPHPISCAGGGGTSFTTLLENNASLFIFSGKEDQYGSLEFKCPKCKRVNKRPRGQLISNCQHCGANVRC